MPDSEIEQRVATLERGQAALRLLTGYLIGKLLTAAPPPERDEIREQIGAIIANSGLPTEQFAEVLTDVGRALSAADGPD